MFKVLKAEAKLSNITRPYKGYTSSSKMCALCRVLQGVGSQVTSQSSDGLPCHTHLQQIVTVLWHLLKSLKAKTEQLIFSKTYLSNVANYNRLLVYKA
jgi:hypothetical protein